MKHTASALLNFSRMKRSRVVQISVALICGFLLGFGLSRLGGPTDRRATSDALGRLSGYDDCLRRGTSAVPHSFPRDLRPADRAFFLVGIQLDCARSYRIPTYNQGDLAKYTHAYYKAPRGMVDAPNPDNYPPTF
jgi:hypothetical protein